MTARLPLVLGSDGRPQQLQGGDTIASIVLPPGFLMPYAATGAPAGWLACDGSAVSRTTYAALFAIIGTTWGVGDGSTTFNLPDLRDRTVIGSSPGSLGSSVPSVRNVGDSGGEEAHTLTTPEIPSHSHSYSLPGQNFSGAASGVHNVVSSLSPSTPNTGSTGGGGAHNNMQPFAVALWVIKT